MQNLFTTLSFAAIFSQVSDPPVTSIQLSAKSPHRTPTPHHGGITVVGAALGEAVGSAIGAALGRADGSGLGARVGTGVRLGGADGSELGARVGTGVVGGAGASVGRFVKVGAGLRLGGSDDLEEGAKLGLESDAEGATVGAGRSIEVGCIVGVAVSLAGGSPMGPGVVTSPFGIRCSVSVLPLTISPQFGVPTATLAPSVGLCARVGTGVRLGGADGSELGARVGTGVVGGAGASVGRFVKVGAGLRLGGSDDLEEGAKLGLESDAEGATVGAGRSIEVGCIVGVAVSLAGGSPMGPGVVTSPFGIRCSVSVLPLTISPQFGVPTATLAPSVDIETARPFPVSPEASTICCNPICPQLSSKAL